MKQILLTSAGLTESTKALFLDALGKDIQDILYIWEMRRSEIRKSRINAKGIETSDTGE